MYSVNRSRPGTAKRLKQLEERGESFEPLTKPLEFAVEPFEEYEAACLRDPREPED